MSLVDKRIENLVPSHYQGYYPRFITFLEKYYAWLYRDSGLSDSEIEDLTNDTSWLQADLDKFIATGQLRYLDTSADSNVLSSAISVLNNTISPGAYAANLKDNFLMEDDFSPSNDNGTPGANDPTVELPSIENKILDSWFNSMGFDRIKRSKIQSIENIDQVLMISLLKHIYAIKGTETSMKLFFNLMFEEDVLIYQPKRRIAIVDEMFVIDDLDSIIRDDEEYQEYSYVIVVSQPPSTYMDIFNTLYKDTLHPSGFRVDIVQFDSGNLGLEFDDGSGYLLLDDDVYLDLS